MIHLIIQNSQRQVHGLVLEKIRNLSDIKQENSEFNQEILANQEKVCFCTENPGASSGSLKSRIPKEKNQDLVSIYSTDNGENICLYY